MNFYDLGRESVMSEYKAVSYHYEEKINNSMLTFELENIIRRFLTKQMARILLLLMNNKMTNKEIAERMNLTSSALGNILHRMKKCEVELLKTSKQDRYVLYSLTPVAREYAKKYLIVKDKNDFKLIHINETETVELLNCRNALINLKDKLEDNWDIQFPRCCISYYEKDVKGEIAEADDFFDAIEELIVKDQSDQLEEILNELGDEISRKNCLIYINKFIYIRKLCCLDAENWKMAYQFIDDILYGDRMCISCDFLAKSDSLSKDDIVKMANSISEIMYYSKKKSLSKGEFFDTWSRYFFPHERLIYYIAEKYGNKYFNR